MTKKLIPDGVITINESELTQVDTIPELATLDSTPAEVVEGVITTNESEVGSELEMIDRHPDPDELVKMMPSPGTKRMMDRRSTMTLSNKLLKKMKGRRKQTQKSRRKNRG